jgi:hypothetical protein
VLKDLGRARLDAELAGGGRCDGASGGCSVACGSPAMKLAGASIGALPEMWLRPPCQQGALPRMRDADSARQDSQQAAGEGFEATSNRPAAGAVAAGVRPDMKTPAGCGVLSDQHGHLTGPLVSRKANPPMPGALS